jgi:hypothetical protein
MLPSREPRSLSAVVPTALLISNPTVKIKALFNQSLEDSQLIAEKFGTHDSGQEYLLSQGERLILIEQNEQQSTFLLYGNRLEDIRIVLPDPTTLPQVTVTRLGRQEDASTVLKITLPVELLKKYKQLLLQRKTDDRPFLVQLPTPEARDGKPEVRPSERLVVGADEAVLEGEGLQDLTRVTFNANEVTKTVSGRSVKLKGLFGNGVTTTSGTKTLAFWFNDRRVDVKVDVVNSKVETVTR